MRPGCNEALHFFYYSNQNIFENGYDEKTFSAKFKTDVLKYIMETGCSNSAGARMDEKNIRYTRKYGIKLKS